MRIRILSIFLCLILILAFFSCRKDKNITDPSTKLQFSRNTILFDTVFSTIGSTTRNFRVFNPYKQPLTINNIHLAGGIHSPFQVNVDGMPLKGGIQNIQIAAKDSMYIFVRVTVNPSPANSMVIRDSIQFDFNGKTQQVILEAIGQNVYLHKPDKYILLSDGSSVPYSIATCGDVWKNDKPHLVFSYFVVDSGCMLTMLPGTRVYMHNSAVFWVFKDGSLQVQGSQNQPVRFEGDRLEPEYAAIPGQWGNIWLSPMSVNNKIDWAVIKNATIGIRADTIGNTNPTLLLSNTIIENMSVAGIYAQGATIRGQNLVISNCAKYSAVLSIGGSYSFRQCTFGDYYTSGTRSSPQILINNWYTDASGAAQTRNLDSAHFYNCIVWGLLPEELKLDSNTAGNVHFNYKFDHCLLRTNNNNTIVAHFNANVNSGDPSFGDTGSNNLNINSGSSAVGIGTPLLIPTFDLNGKPVHNPPDAGAYQH
jgi:hypothetical protein